MAVMMEKSSPFMVKGQKNDTSDPNKSKSTGFWSLGLNCSSTGKFKCCLYHDIVAGKINK